MLNDPPTVKGPQLNRKGKLLLEFGTRSNGRYEHPRLHWTDGHNVSHTFDLLDIESFRQPMLSEVDGTYRFAIPEHCFFLSTHSGTRLLFEAVDENEMTGITMALRDLICRFSRKIVTGENDWLVQLMLASVGDGGHVSTLAEVEEVLPMAVAEVTDHLVKKTTLIQRAQAMRSNRLRSRRDVMK